MILSNALYKGTIATRSWLPYGSIDWPASTNFLPSVVTHRYHFGSVMMPIEVHFDRLLYIPHVFGRNMTERGKMPIYTG
jgi:hypothetical protein